MVSAANRCEHVRFRSFRISERKVILLHILPEIIERFIKDFVTRYFYALNLLILVFETRIERREEQVLGEVQIATDWDLVCGINKHKVVKI